MSDTAVRTTTAPLPPPELPSPEPPSPEPPGRASMSRRSVLALVCAGTAVTAAAPISMLLDEDGPAADPTGPADPGPVTRGLGTWTSFGTVAVLGASRSARRGWAAHAAHHEDVTDPTSPLVNRTWSDTVRVDVEVHNGTARPILLALGQFRLLVGSSGATVSPYDVGRPPAPVPPGQTVTTWIDYLAPAEESEFSVAYDDTGRPRPLMFRLDLPAGSAAGTAEVVR